MLQRSARGRFLEVILFTLASLVLYHSGIGFWLFLVPLQVVASRRGVQSLLATDGLFLFVFLALRLVPFLGGSLIPDVLSIVEIVFVALLLLGAVAVNLGFRGARTLYKMAGASAIAGLACIPLAVWLSGSAEYQTAMRSVFTEVSRALASLFSREGAADAMASTLLSPEALRRMTDAYLSRSLLALYFLLLSFSWWAGQLSASRSAPDGRPRFRLSSFRLESSWLWPLIAAFALILLDLVVRTRGPASGATGGIAGAVGTLSYAAWNVGLVMLILYGLQGLAILRFQFEKRGLPRMLWLLLLIGLVVLAASPGVGTFIVIALPCFGVSETWVRYRISSKQETR